jgi:hypothetical protein
MKCTHLLIHPRIKRLTSLADLRDAHALHMINLTEIRLDERQVACKIYKPPQKEVRFGAKPVVEL